MPTFKWSIIKISKAVTPSLTRVAVDVYDEHHSLPVIVNIELSNRSNVDGS